MLDCTVCVSSAALYLNILWKIKLFHDFWHFDVHIDLFKLHIIQLQQSIVEHHSTLLHWATWCLENLQNTQTHLYISKQYIDLRTSLQFYRRNEPLLFSYNFSPFVVSQYTCIITHALKDTSERHFYSNCIADLIQSSLFCKLFSAEVVNFHCHVRLKFSPKSYIKAIH